MEQLSDISKTFGTKLSNSNYCQLDVSHVQREETVSGVLVFSQGAALDRLGPALTGGRASVEPSKMKRGVLSLLSLLSFLSLLSLLVSPATASPDGKYWWMGAGEAFGDSQDNQVSCGEEILRVS